MSTEWTNQRVVVMGLGRFGGGVGAARWLARQGARVIATDRAPAETLQASLDELAGVDVTLRLGGHDPADFRTADLVVVNPAVPETSEYVRVAREAGVSITTEINLFVERCPARVVGVTGSVGKSTVTAMIGHILQEATGTGSHGGGDPPVVPPGRGDGAGVVAAGRGDGGGVVAAGRGGGEVSRAGGARLRRVWVGGNIGRSLLDELPEMTAEDVVVLELSSFQLQRTPAIRWSPHVAVVTNITPNHLDWHGTFAAYVAAKLNILRFQEPERDVAVMQDTPALRRLIDQLYGDLSGVWRYGLDGDKPVAVQQSSPGVDCDDRRLRWADVRLNVPGRHNRENAAAALTVARALGVPDGTAVAALRTFAALPHRLQRVAERDSVTYYDDSKSTTPEAALTALGAFDRPLLVILGGHDKGSDLGLLAREAAARARFCACIGTTGPRLVDAIRAAGGAAEPYRDLAAAVAACRARAEAGDVVLLSPACASWDQFADYRARGALFARLARGEEAAR